MTKLESGRSMVEMLGVLAIIGVLSIGGILGYKMAMNRYNANNALAAAAQIAVIADTLNQGAGGTATLANIDNPTLTGVSEISGSKTDGVVTVTLTVTDDGVATAIANVTGGSCSTTKCELTMTNGKLQ